jgi:hypothetical protein
MHRGFISPLLLAYPSRPGPGSEMPPGPADRRRSQACMGWSGAGWAVRQPWRPLRQDIGRQNPLCQMMRQNSRNGLSCHGFPPATTTRIANRTATDFAPVFGPPSGVRSAIRDEGESVQRRSTALRPRDLIHQCPCGRLLREALDHPDVTRGTAGPAKDLAASCASAQRFSRASFGLGSVVTFAVVPDV